MKWNYSSSLPSAIKIEKGKENSTRRSRRASKAPKSAIKRNYTNVILWNEDVERAIPFPLSTTTTACKRIQENDDKNTTQSVHNATICLQRSNDCNRVKCWEVFCWPATALTEWIVGIISARQWTMQKMRLQQQSSPGCAWDENNNGLSSKWKRNGWENERGIREMKVSGVLVIERVKR